MEILVGTNAPIKHKVYWRGAPSAADFPPTVTLFDITGDPLYNINPNTEQAQLTASPIETDVGVYEVYIPITLMQRDRKFKIVWEYEINGDLLVKTDDLFVITPYVDITQAGEELGLGSDPSDPNYKTYFQIVQAERYARKTIESFTTQKFYPYLDKNTVYGAGSDILPLPAKINKIYKLYQNDVLVYDSINNINNWIYTPQISESGFGIRIDRSSLVDNTVYSANGLVPPSINDSYFGAFGKDQTYRIEGRFGWDHVPNDIEHACIELMKDYFSRDRIWRNKYIKSISTFDWDFEYSSDAYKTTGNLYVDNLLADYVLNQMVVI